MVVATLTLRPGQKAAMDATIEAFAAAQKHVRAICEKAGSTDKALIHQLSQQVLCGRFGLSDDLAFQAVEEGCLRLGSAGPIAYRSPVVSYGPLLCRFDAEAQTVSLSTVTGRLRHVPFRIAPWQRYWLCTGRVERALLRRTGAGRYLLIITFTARNTEGATG